MQPTPNVSRPTAMTSDNQTESRNFGNRIDYKRPTRNKFEIRFHSILTPVHTGTGPVPRNTFVAQVVNGTEYRSEYNVQQVCFPEWLHEKLYVRRFCGSTKAASMVRNSVEMYYVFDYFAASFTMLVFPAIGFTALGFAMTSPETVPTWFPYIGTFFYTLGFPTFCLSVLLFERNHLYLMNIDDKSLKLIIGIVVFVVCICSPMYGIWATVSYMQQGAAVAVEHTLGLNVGAYICCALSIPCWIRTAYPVAVVVDTILQDGMASDVLCVVSFIVVTILLIGSMIHQSLVGELVWFPYLGVLGTLFVIPLFCTIVVLNVLLQFDSFEFVLGCTWLLFCGITDGFAWLLAERNFSQPVEFLIDDTLLYTGAVFAYIALVSLGLLLAFEISESYSCCTTRECTSMAILC